MKILCRLYCHCNIRERALDDAAVVRLFVDCCLVALNTYWHVGIRFDFEGILL